MAQKDRSLLASFARGLLFFLGLLLLLWAINALALPHVGRGGTWKTYKRLPDSSVDVFITGTSHAHSNINPTLLSHENSIRSFVGSGSAMDLTTTYYYLEQAYESQSPSLVAIDVAMLSEDVNSLNLFQEQNIAFMPLGKTKAKAVVASLEFERWHSTLLPIHSSWRSFHRSLGDPVFLGYAASNKVVPQEAGEGETPFDERIYQKNYAQLLDSIELALEHNSKVFLFLSPTAKPNSYSAWSSRLNADIAKDFPDVGFEDFNTSEYLLELKINLEEDFYDSIHFNYSGAEKYTAYLGNYLAEHYPASISSSSREISEDTSFWETE